MFQMYRTRTSTNGGHRFRRALEKVLVPGISFAVFLYFKIISIDLRPLHRLQLPA
jgi:hypothetical protein